jgi:hypothetical protein
MAHHKRCRAKAQRAGCYCGGKLAKSLMRPARMHRGAGKVYGSRGAELRLRERAREAE